MTRAYRAHVVGSLLRPEPLKRARSAHTAGQLRTSVYKEVEDRAVDQAIALQEAAGLDLITDGEQRRGVFFDQLVRGVDGEAGTLAIQPSGSASAAQFQTPAYISGKLRWRSMLTPEEFSYARARARRPVKVTLPSPLGYWLLWASERSRAAYPDPCELFADGVDLVRDEARELVALGCEHIQIDAPELMMLADPTARAKFAALGITPERVTTEGIDMLNAVADVPGATFSLHICRGNFRSQWMTSGGYAQVFAEVVPRATNYDTFMLEYDDDRSGSFAPLATLPSDKQAVLGLISTKHDVVEDAASIVKRIEQATQYISRDQLGLSTQCGFASTEEGNLISTATQEAKLSLVAQVASDVWG
jgi:5-methyltetrahydropteroyltriglutamate--homocysteine methyltransferase